MTITQLKYVLAVAEHKNFTLAAEKCFGHGSLAQLRLHMRYAYSSMCTATAFTQYVRTAST